MYYNIAGKFLLAILALSTVKDVKTDVSRGEILQKTQESINYYTVVVNASKVVNKLHHFWKSTGFCPPDPHEEFYKYMATNDIAQNIIYIGSIPNQGIEQVRIHFLLDLVSMGLDDKGSMVLSFTYLDKALDLLVKDSGLRPGFELMGNPSGYFTDFDEERQIYDWMELIRRLGAHLIG